MDRITYFFRSLKNTRLILFTFLKSAVNCTMNQAIKVWTEKFPLATRVINIYFMLKKLREPFVLLCYQNSYWYANSSNFHLSFRINFYPYGIILRTIKLIINYTSLVPPVNLTSKRNMHTSITLLTAKC